MKKAYNLFAGFLSVGIIVASIYGVIHRREIVDWAILRGYDPPAKISTLAHETTMNNRTRDVFYVNRPSIDDKEKFRQECEATEQSIVLGCYVSNKGIFLLNVKDDRLNGVVQVTAAHETLHAMYDRLDAKEKSRVDKMTANFFATITDERIKSTVENYRKKDPSVVPNELHSILGTEVRDLSPELETYYARYFNNRKNIVAYSEKYEQTFINLKNQVDQYDKQLNGLKNSIDNNQKLLSGMETDINNEKGRLDNLLAAGSTQAYNDSVPGFNSRVTAYNNLIATTKRQIDQYNDIVSKRNQIATTEQELVQAIDSNSLPKRQ